MKKLAEARKFLAGFGLALGAGFAALQEVIVNEIPGMKDMPDGERIYLVGIFSFFGLIILVTVVVRSLISVLEKFRWARAIFLGSDFVEGVWIDVVYDSKAKKYLQADCCLFTSRMKKLL